MKQAGGTEMCKEHTNNITYTLPIAHKQKHSKA